MLQTLSCKGCQFVNPSLGRLDVRVPQWVHDPLSATNINRCIIIQFYTQYVTSSERDKIQPTRFYRPSFHHMTVMIAARHELG